jgi:hypothetical protein
MNDTQNVQDSDLRGAEAALRRAGQYARELGERTQTPVYVLRNGTIVDLVAGQAGLPSVPRDRT